MDSLIEGVSNLESSGKTKIQVSTESDTQTYDANAIVYDGNLVLDGQKTVEGCTLNNNIYEFGNKTEDVAKSQTDMAKNMVILKVNGDLTINEGITVTACKSDSGFGGPKGMLIYCTGTLTNNGTISMTARGGIAKGQNIYLWKNENNETNPYEYIPATGAAGAAQVGGSGSFAGNKGNDGNNRATGGGATGAVMSKYSTYWKKYEYDYSGTGGTGNSYSGGSGGSSIITLNRDNRTVNCANVTSTGNGGNGFTVMGYGRTAGGGAGNPCGTGSINAEVNPTYNGQNGTGGLLIIYANIINNGSNSEILSQGSSGGNGMVGGGASGGGSINIFVKKEYNNQPKNINANGGSATGTITLSGKGGNGSVSVGSVETENYVSIYKNY